MADDWIGEKALDYSSEEKDSKTSGVGRFERFNNCTQHHSQQLKVQEIEIKQHKNNRQRDVGENFPADDVASESKNARENKAENATNYDPTRPIFCG